MRIALTFNEKRSSDESEAEFDTPDTIGAIARTLASAGHVVTPVEVSGPVDKVILALERLHPELVFNLAEGRTGRFREAFYPALFEQLGIAHTGSGAGALALCHDKALAKRVVAAARVSTPYAQLVRRLDELRAMPLPAIVKPNFEGSSKGITQASVVPRVARAAAVAACERRYPAGALVEEYVDGVDVAVGWVDGLGVLPAIAYAYVPTGPHRIYDLALKRAGRAVRPYAIDAPAAVAAAARAFAALGVVGYGRADFRLTPDGDAVFLEMNPLPTLADDDLYVASGLSRPELLAAIVAAATPRRRTGSPRSPARRAAVARCALPRGRPPAP